MIGRSLISMTWVGERYEVIEGKHHQKSVKDACAAGLDRAIVALCCAEEILTMPAISGCRTLSLKKKATTIFAGQSNHLYQQTF